MADKKISWAKRIALVIVSPGLIFLPFMAYFMTQEFFKHLDVNPFEDFDMFMIQVHRGRFLLGMIAVYIGIPILLAIIRIQKIREEKERERRRNPFIRR